MILINILTLKFYYDYKIKNILALSKCTPECLWMRDIRYPIHSEVTQENKVCVWGGGECNIQIKDDTQIDRQTIDRQIDDRSME